MSDSMEAVVFDAFGGPEVLRVAPRPMPEAGPGEVVVRVAASTVNPTDLMMRNGTQAPMMQGLIPPFTAGMEFSGHVHAAGAGVGLPVGAPVIGVVNPRRPAGGAQAQFVVVPAASVAVVGPGVDLVAAATVPMNALTAAMSIEMLGLTAGQSVLVTGGAGMLGGSAIQLAHRAGLRVLANANPADAGMLRGFGADHVLPRDEGLAEALRALAPEGVDGLIDGALIGNEVSHLVRDGAVAVSLRKSHPIHDPRLRCTVVSVIEGMERTDLLAAIAGDLSDGRLRPRVAEGGRFDFREAVAANRMAEASRVRGRVVLVFGPEGRA